MKERQFLGLVDKDLKIAKKDFTRGSPSVSLHICQLSEQHPTSLDKQHSIVYCIQHDLAVYYTIMQ